MHFVRRTVTVFVAALGLLIGVGAVAASGNEFVVRCFYSHSLNDDPIVFPAMPGKSHLHDFMGNTSTNASSTYASMIASATTCKVGDDTAAYWAPAVYKAGQPVPYTHDANGDIRAYYLNNPSSGAVSHLPADLRMIQGDAHSISTAGDPAIDYSCGASTNASTPIRSHPYDCTPYAAQYNFVTGVTVRVNFPRCWDGVGKQPSDMVEGVTRAECLAVVGRQWLPSVSVRWHFGVMNPCFVAAPCGPDTPPSGNIALSFDSGPWYTFHADFWQTWFQTKVDSLVDNCLQPGTTSCGFLPPSPHS